jgi:hypothetical protein
VNRNTWDVVFLKLNEVKAEAKIEKEEMKE